MLTKADITEKKVFVNFKKLHPNAVIPKYAKPGDAAVDLTAISIEDTPNEVVYKTGLAIEIPSGFVGLLFPRSSISKTCLTLSNGIGVIDSSYRGDITFKFNYVTDKKSSYPIYKVGDRIGQLMILPYPMIKFNEVAELSETERGTGSYGSTGK